MLEEVIPLTPVHFFSFQVDCHYFKKNLERRHKLPDLSPFHGDFAFAEMFLGWNEKGIALEARVNAPFDESEFPDFQSGDSIELFIDTRDVKTTAYPTKFCHHFYFLPVPFEENGDAIQAGEVTRFRADDAHELCDPSKLIVVSEKGRREQIVKILMPAECLHGYDPVLINRLGFSYRINKKNGHRQFFSANDADFTIESQPSLWASLKLLKE